LATVVDIANLALSHIGEGTTVSNLTPPDATPAARHCARFYPIARDELLEQHAWTFATARQPLALLALTVAGWDYVYEAPSDMIRALEVYELGGNPNLDTPIKFDVETQTDGTRVIVTNQADAELRYIFRAVVPERFTPLFTVALSWLLASYIAGPIIKGDTGIAASKTCFTVYRERFAEAARSSANNSRQRLDHTPAWISER